MISEKRPRHYVAEIVVMPTLAERRAALAAAPVDMQPLIRQMIICYFDRKKIAQGRQAGDKAQAIPARTG